LKFGNVLRFRVSAKEKDVINSRKSLKRERWDVLVIADAPLLLLGVVFIKLLDRPLRFVDSSLPTSLGFRVACFDLLLLLFTPVSGMVFAE
jgi:hypothetical protein